MLHNLRSALDSLAYELAAQLKGDPLTAREERVTYFPWRISPSEYNRFFGIADDPSKCDDASQLRGAIYNPEAQNAMRAVQPFWYAEMANFPESERQQLSEDAFRWSTIHRLHRLSNIDKHRRLPAVGVGWPRMFYWGSDEGDVTLVFTGGRGAVLRCQTFQRAALTVAARTVGLPGFHPHELRHTAASLAIASGADIKVVQQMLGHRSAVMTLDQYGHLFGEGLDVVADAMGVARGPRRWLTGIRWVPERRWLN